MIFNEKRIAFVVIGDRLVLQDPTDVRECHIWMRCDLLLPASAYLTYTRGYMLEGRIQFFTGGSDYSISDRVTTAVIDAAIEGYRKLIGNEFTSPDDIIIGNGCIVRDKGVQWDPILVFYDGEWKLAR